MLNLSDITGYYIEVTFSDQQKLLILDAFSLLESFGLNYYEDKYVDIISMSDNLDTSTQSLLFMEKLSDDLKDVIAQHAITLSKEQPISLQELNEIGHLLLLLPNLEDYSDVAYRVNSDKPARNIFISLVERYSTLSVLKAMEVIEGVDEGLIESLRELSKGALEVSSDELNASHLKYIKSFFSFIDKTPCLGLSLIEQGYRSSMTLEELVNILPFDIQKHVEMKSITDMAQVSLDVLSLLVVTQDDFNMPLFKFKRNAHLFTDNLELVGKLNNIIFKIVDDFALQLEAEKQGERLNGN